MPDIRLVAETSGSPTRLPKSQRMVLDVLDNDHQLVVSTGDTGELAAHIVGRCMSGLMPTRAFGGSSAVMTPMLKTGDELGILVDSRLASINFVEKASITRVEFILNDAPGFLGGQESLVPSIPYFAPGQSGTLTDCIGWDAQGRALVAAVTFNGPPTWTGPDSNIRSALVVRLNLKHATLAWCLREVVRAGLADRMKVSGTTWFGSEQAIAALKQLTDEADQ